MMIKIYIIDNKAIEDFEKRALLNSITNGNYRRQAGLQADSKTDITHRISSDEWHFVICSMAVMINFEIVCLIGCTHEKLN